MMSVVATQLSVLRDGKIDELGFKLQNQAILLQARACRNRKPTEGRILTALAIVSNPSSQLYYSGSDRLLLPDCYVFLAE